MQKKTIADTKEQKGEKMLKSKYWFLSAAVALLALGAGCHFYGKKPVSTGLPVINVTTVDATEEVIRNSKSYVALVEPINSVDVVAKVSGSLDKVNFKEGGFVHKDDALFVIDKDRYQANYDLAKAQLESAKANLTRAERDYNRQKELSSKNIASKATFDNAESTYLQGRAAVAQAEAQLALAKIDLDNTEVKAYIDGYIGKTKVTVGNYVNVSGEPLARVVQVDPIRIAFSIADKEFLSFQAANQQDGYVINIELPNGKIYSENLEKVFANNEVNMGTATVAVYADVKNEERLLKPGAYVKVSVVPANPPRALVVPEISVVQSAEDSFVYIVDESNTARMRKVTLGETFDGKQVILSGIRAGDKVMTSGLSNMMLRDGAAVAVNNAK